LRLYLSLTGFISDSALLQYSQIAKLPRPTDNQRRDVYSILGSSILSGNSLGRFQSLDLAGVDGPAVYESKFADDLVLLEATEEENDSLSRWLVHPLFSIFHCVWGETKVSLP
jgi:hypothetical protein